MDIDLTTTSTIRDGNVVAWFEVIGPERAKEILKTYKVDYRKYRPTYADGLARDMGSDHWEFDGAPIKIDIEGNFFDGNHRMHAVIISGKPQLFLVIAGLPVAAYNTTDTGLARTYGDTLRRRGYQNVSQRTALVKLIGRWENGVSLDDTKRFTQPELDAIHDKYVDSISRAVANAVSTARKTNLSGALVAFSWWVLTQIDNEQAYIFMVSLAEGENLRRGQPVYTLRERLRYDAEVRYTRNEYMSLVFSAWNAFREDREIQKVNLPSGNVTRSKMVTPR